MPESSSSRTPFGNRSVDGSQTLLKSVWQHVSLDFPVMQDIYSQKTSLFVRCSILGLFGNTLAGDHMYSRHNWRKLPQHVKTPFSQKRKTFFGPFIAFSESRQNFAHFVKKGQLYSLNSKEIIDSENWGSFNGRKLLFQNSLQQSKCWRVPNTAEICLAPTLS